jgi:GNAT superfamily N-acetyltransferase
MWLLINIARAEPCEYLYDAARIEGGILMLFPPFKPELPPSMVLSGGTPEALTEMVRRTLTGIAWITFYGEDVYKALSNLVRFERCTPALIYVRESTERLPQGNARRLTPVDLPVLEAFRPERAWLLAKPPEHGAIFGVVEGASYVADASTGPVWGPYWLVQELFMREECRRRGYAKAIVAACVNFILDSGKIPVYEVAARTPSRRVRSRQGIGLYWSLERVKIL